MSISETGSLREAINRRARYISPNFSYLKIFSALSLVNRKK